MDKTYAGPELHVGADGKYTVDAAFVRGLIAWFKDGKPLPRRYVWEIVLGAHGHFASEESLVTLEVEEGMTVDVIGDVHGTCFLRRREAMCGQLMRAGLRGQASTTTTCICYR